MAAPPAIGTIVFVRNLTVPHVAVQRVLPAIVAFANTFDNTVNVTVFDPTGNPVAAQDLPFIGGTDTPPASGPYCSIS